MTEITVILALLINYCYCVLDTGYPAGYMSECPGMNRSTVFSEATKRTLSAVVMWPSSSIFEPSEKRCSLSAAGAACAARAINVTKRKTHVVVSGYLDASFSPVARTLAAAYLKRRRNVILLEVFPVLVRSYPLAARATKPLGQQLGLFLAELTHLGLPPNRLELVGGSLGAHIAYFASVKYRQITGWKPNRLTGLDPAGPCFRNVPARDRFNSDGAVKVDVLHTNIDGFGLADPVGHVDFYANGGEFQPSMASGFILPCFVLCSHVRAASYFAMAHANQDKFLAVKCDSLVKVRRGDCYDKQTQTNIFGPHTNFSRPGIYYLPTTEIAPYYLGNKGLKKRRYGSNFYLTYAAPDKDMTI